MQDQISLISTGTFTSHSGKSLGFKIDCDAFSDADIEAFAAIIAQKMMFGDVVGIPRGGMRLAKALERYTTHGPYLIVDDVLTTGSSMESAREDVTDRGVVLFARGPCPDWITPVFSLSEKFW